MSKKTWKSDLQKSFYPFFNWLDNVGKGKTLNERTRDIMLADYKLSGLELLW